MESYNIKYNASALIDIEKQIQTPKDKINSILIIGNTVGMFGYFVKKENVIVYDSYKVSDIIYFNNCNYLIKLLQNGTYIKVISFNEETDAYYNMLKSYIFEYKNISGTIDICRTNVFNTNSKNHNKDIKDLQTKWINTHIINMGMKFDVCIMNAPYQNGLHEKFEAAAIDMVNDEIVFVGPLSWVVGKQKNKEMCDMIDKYYSEINTVNPALYFDANIGGIFGITYVSKHKSNVLLYNGVHQISSYNIKQRSDDEILKKLYALSFDDCIHYHILKNSYDAKGFPQASVMEPSDDSYIYAISPFSGHSIARSKEIGEYYNMVSNSLKYNKRCGKYIDIKKHASKPDQIYYIPFNTEIELQNYWKYIHTDFVSLQLYLYKTTLHLDAGELKYVPWIDFTQEWDDLKLFKHFKITKEQLEHIYDVLPNYFNNDRAYVLEHYDDK